MSSRQSYFAALQGLPQRLIYFLLDMEGIQNDFQPQRLPEYAAYLREQHVDGLAEQAARLQTLTPPEDVAGFHELLCHGVEATANAARLFAEFGESLDIGKALKTWRELGDAYRIFYAVRSLVPGMRRFWVYQEAFDAIDLYDPPQGEGGIDALGATLVQASAERNWYARYVPEWYDPRQSWPVVVALHGGWGRGDTFLWPWVRPAKTRGYIVLSPKSAGTTWTEDDLPSILRMVEETAAQFSVDRGRVLLMGLSDGGIFTYLFGLNHPEPFAALAVVAANFMPFMVPAATRQRPIYIAHGEADHMFHVRIARGAACYLHDRGYPVEYHERAEYGHYYPPEENRLILDWFERHVGPGPSPAEPGSRSASSA